MNNGCEQSLNTADHCGACGKRCTLGSTPACSGASTCAEQLAETPGAKAPSLVATDGGDLYWVTSTDSGDTALRLHRIKAGSTTSEIVVDLPEGVRALPSVAYGAGGVYLTAPTLALADGGESGRVLRFDIASGDLSEIASKQNAPTAIAVDDARVAWVAGNHDIVTATIDGGTPAVIATNEEYISALVLVPGLAVWSTASGVGAVRAGPFDGGAPVTLAACDARPGACYSGSLAPLAGGIAAGSSRGLSFIPLDGGTPFDSRERSADIVRAADPTTLFTVNADPQNQYYSINRISLLPTGFSTPESVAVDFDPIAGLAVSDQSVTWMSDRLLRTPR